MPPTPGPPATHAPPLAGTPDGRSAEHIGERRRNENEGTLRTAAAPNTVSVRGKARMQPKSVGVERPPTRRVGLGTYQAS